MKKYPRTPYWVSSPTKAKDDKYVGRPELFLNTELVITEKIDGSNTLLYNGEVYGRGANTPAHENWRAMVRKHHSWKVPQLAKSEDIGFYGEDIYGVHSIEYEPVYEDMTLYLFAMRHFESDTFFCFQELERWARLIGISTVPVVYRGFFKYENDLNLFLIEEHNKPSLLGGEREGLVIRREKRFNGKDFAHHVCKSVRENHVQTDEHWTKNWKPCKLRS